MIDLIGLSTKTGSEIVETKDIATKFGKPDRSLARCGTNVLHRLGKNETFESLAYDVSANALKNAGIPVENINGIYASVCCPTTEYLMPGLARVVGDRLGIANIPMVTMSMGCVGGIHALQNAYNQLKADFAEGKKGTALVVAGDHISRALDETSWDTAGIFSDGVAAVVLSTEKNGAYQVKNVRSANLQGNIKSMNIINPSETTKDRRAIFRMDGTQVFDFAYKQAFPTILRLLGLTELPENCYFIPHQASGVVLKYLQKENRVKSEQIYTEGVGKVGNITGASILFGLEDVLKRDIAKDRDIILGAFGAELAVGAVHLQKRK